MMKKKLVLTKAHSSRASQELIYYLLLLLQVPFKSGIVWGFPGGLVVKNAPADAGDTGSFSAPGTSRMPWGH